MTSRHIYHEHRNVSSLQIRVIKETVEVCDEAILQSYRNKKKRKLDEFLQDSMKRY